MATSTRKKKRSIATKGKTTSSSKTACATPPKQTTKTTAKSSTVMEIEKTKVNKSASSTTASQTYKSKPTKSHTKQSPQPTIDETSQEEDTSMTDNDYHLHKIFVSIVIQAQASTSFLEELRDKYKFLTTTLMEADENLLILGANPDSTCTPLRDPEDVPSKMVSMNKYFFTSSKAPKEEKNGGKGSIW